MQIFVAPRTTRLFARPLPLHPAPSAVVTSWKALGFQAEAMTEVDAGAQAVVTQPGTDKRLAAGSTSI